jgi:hypothetical protein
MIRKNWYRLLCGVAFNMMEKNKMLWRNNRNFNQGDFEDQKYYLLAEHNDLITKVRHDLEARELKIMDYVVSKIKPDDCKNFKILLYELSRVMITGICTANKYKKTNIAATVYCPMRFTCLNNLLIFTLLMVSSVSFCLLYHPTLP